MVAANNDWTFRLYDATGHSLTDEWSVYDFRIASREYDLFNFDHHIPANPFYTIEIDLRYNTSSHITEISEIDNMYVTIVLVSGRRIRHTFQCARLRSIQTVDAISTDVIISTEWLYQNADYYSQTPVCRGCSAKLDWRKVGF